MTISGEWNLPLLLPLPCMILESRLHVKLILRMEVWVILSRGCPLNLLLLFGMFFFVALIA